MPSNNKQYAKEYQRKRRQKLIKELGGKCEGCNIKTDLIVHHIYTKMNMRVLRDKKQHMFDLPSVRQSTKLFMNDKEREKRRKDLRDNTDNMVLLCYSCWRVLEHKYGRKTKIGRKEVIESFGG